MENLISNGVKKGFSTIFIVIVIGSVALALVIWLETGGLWFVKETNDIKNSRTARGLVNACAELALENMQENNAYTGSGNTTLNGNTCSYTVTNNGGNSRTIEVTATVATIVKKIQIQTDIFNPITITAWQDVP